MIEERCRTLLFIERNVVADSVRDDVSQYIGRYREKTWMLRFDSQAEIANASFQFLFILAGYFFEPDK